ncbi:Bcr/CflA family drug resistance efflux transporter [Bermanella sp. 47_1433_sub80_T6]|nr:Bcr/CflA family drug resistance efflux transporter [Bermanella sp. 47_1433_sub80_T6]
MSAQPSSISSKEFIALMAMIMSLMALAIDAMLPALGAIGSSLNVLDPNDNQLVISSIFLGMSMGLMLYGPISDSFGRKKSIYLGVSIFLVGDLISLFAQDFSLMILGRLLQGFGAAACRVVSIAMIRDKFSGKEMASVMSLIMMTFIMVPALAPSVGQLILLFAPWQGIFVLLFVFALCSMLWLHLRQSETLAPENRIPFSYNNVKSGVLETLKHPVSLPYTLAGGIMFGSFIGYLSSSQQILQIQYQTGELFALYFGALALALGLASFANSKLVMKFAMEKLCTVALSTLSLISILFFIYAQAQQGQPPLLAFMIYLGLTFFCFGILFGNFNTLAVHPLGHIAGVANSVISTVSTFISVLIGALIGQLYDGTVLPLILGFAGCGILTLVIVVRIPKQHA